MAQVVNMKARSSVPSSIRLPGPLAGHCAVQVNSSHTLVVGGAVGGILDIPALTGRVWMLGPGGWAEMEGLAVARAGHACSASLSRDNGLEVVVAGGFTVVKDVRRLLDTVEVFNVGTGGWRRGEDLPYPTFGAGLIQLAGSPLMIGGRAIVGEKMVQLGQTFQYRRGWRTAPLTLSSPRDMAVTVEAPPFC